MPGTPVISNPLGAFGTTSVVEKFGPLTMEFEATADIPRRTVVLITSACKITKAATGTAAAGSTLGITVDAIGSGKVGKVVVFGPIDEVPADGTINQYSPVIASTTTAGSVIAKAAPTTGEGLGFAIAAASGGTCTVWVNRTIGGIT